ncbi:hypothetical protein [Cetobacterium sp.]|uniref:hypothetical protein n=1 Tax=Cetobacterium sp. TaxID=2071632 RepID=UPI003F2B0703
MTNLEKAKYYAENCFMIKRTEDFIWMNTKLGIAKIYDFTLEQYHELLNVVKFNKLKGKEV